MLSGLFLWLCLSLAIYTVRAAQQNKRTSSTLLTGIVACLFFIGFAATFTLSAVNITSYIIAMFWVVVIVSIFEGIWDEPVGEIDDGRE